MRMICFSALSLATKAAMPMKIVRCNRGCHDSPALVLEAGVGAWIVKRAASTDYRPGVRPLQSNEAGCEIPTAARTYHRPRNARLADLISVADQTYDP